MRSVISLAHGDPTVLMSRLGLDAYPLRAITLRMRVRHALSTTHLRMHVFVFVLQEGDILQFITDSDRMAVVAAWKAAYRRCGTDSPVVTGKSCGCGKTTPPHFVRLKDFVPKLETALRLPRRDDRHSVRVGDELEDVSVLQHKHKHTHPQVRDREGVAHAHPQGHRAQRVRIRAESRHQNHRVTMGQGNH